MKERTKFVLEWEQRWNEAEGGPVNMAQLCRMFGITIARQRAATSPVHWVFHPSGAG